MAASRQSSVKYIATVAPVREVALLGRANLDFWQARLAGTGLYATEIENQACVQLTATRYRYLGVPCGEVCVSVLVGRQSRNAEPEGAYLVQAFQSFAPFACIERNCFGTPYAHARVEVNVDSLVGFRLVRRGTMWLAAHANVPPAAADHSPHVVWEKPIFLPPGMSSKRDAGKFFWATLEGNTHVFPYLPEQHAISIARSTELPVFDWLLDSGFAATEWHVRAQAQHSRSKTLTRDQLSQS